MTLEEKLKRIPDWIYMWAVTEIHNLRARQLVWDVYHESGNILCLTGIECISFDDYIKSIDENETTPKTRS